MGGPLLAACSPAAAPSPSPTPAPPRATPLPPAETTSIRVIANPPATCEAPAWLLVDFLKEEGFTDIQTPPGGLPAGQADFGATYANYFVSGLDAGFPWITVTGVHTGCIEIWATPGIASVRDLKGKRVDISDRLAGPRPDLRAAGTSYGFIASLLSQIGMSPADMQITEVPGDADTEGRFFEGKSDVLFEAGHGGALMRRDLRLKDQRVILDTTMDKPWSQYFCCLWGANRDFARASPVATKRTIRAFLRASDEVAKDKRAAVRKVIDSGVYAKNKTITSDLLYDTIKDLSYDWREYDPEETLRFYAQRLGDMKLIKKSPQQIVDEGAQFAYMRQLAKELKP